MTKDKYSFDDLLDIMIKLRQECPWDKEQTHESLKRYLIEEAYEVLEAIDTKKPEVMADEFGDLLLQVVFHAQIAKENNEYDIDDVTTAVSKKMINRHPHIFADVCANNADEVLTNWESIKKKEKGIESNKEVLENISKYLPALLRCLKVWDKLVKWNAVDENLESLCQKSIYLTKELQKNGENHEKILGELFFTNVGISRLLGLSPEEELIKFLENYIKTIEM